MGDYLRTDPQNGEPIEVTIEDWTDFQDGQPNYRQIWFYFPEKRRLWTTIFYRETRHGDSERSLSELDRHSVCVAGMDESAALAACEHMIAENAISRVCHYFDV